MNRKTFQGSSMILGSYAVLLMVQFGAFMATSRNASPNPIDSLTGVELKADIEWERLGTRIQRNLKKGEPSAKTAQAQLRGFEDACMQRWGDARSIPVETRRKLVLFLKATKYAQISGSNYSSSINIFNDVVLLLFDSDNPFDVHAGMSGMTSLGIFPGTQRFNKMIALAEGEDGYLAIGALETMGQIVLKNASEESVQFENLLWRLINRERFAYREPCTECGGRVRALAAELLIQRNGASVIETDSFLTEININAGCEAIVNIVSNALSNNADFVPSVEDAGKYGMLAVRALSVRADPQRESAAIRLAILFGTMIKKSSSRDTFEARIFEKWNSYDAFVQSLLKTYIPDRYPPISADR